MGSIGISGKSGWMGGLGKPGGGGRFGGLGTTGGSRFGGFGMIGGVKFPGFVTTGGGRLGGRGTTARGGKPCTSSRAILGREDTAGTTPGVATGAGVIEGRAGGAAEAITGGGTAVALLYGYRPNVQPAGRSTGQLRSYHWVPPGVGFIKFAALGPIPTLKMAQGLPILPSHR